MCVVDASAKEVAVAQFLREHPQTGDARGGHPALRGCEEVNWSEIPGCPADIPGLFEGLLDPAAAPEAVRVLGNVLMHGVLHLSPAMPAALPFLMRLAADSTVTVRADLVDLVAVAVELSRPVSADDQSSVLLLGSDADHPERALCRLVLSEQASLLGEVLGGGMPTG